MQGPSTLGLEAIYRTEAGRVSAWIRRLDPEGDTEDLLHEVFLVVGKRLPSFRGESALGTWLHAITARVVSAKRRRRRIRRFLFGREEAGLRAERRGPRTPEELFEGREVGALLYELLESLSERDRMLLILHELDGLSGAELAQVAGLSPSGVFVALHRARARLRRAFLARHGEKERA
jgi:RNA polymerase sigma-70 factor, ECF subfamily